MNNSDCAISISPDNLAYAEYKTPRDWSHPAHVSITFEDTFVDNRFQEVSFNSGDNMAGIFLGGLVPAMSGFVRFNGKTMPFYCVAPPA
eukprot:SAG22_NODE_4848_length_1151_cov_1.134030_2_plen_88_part_01